MSSGANWAGLSIVVSLVVWGPTSSVAVAESCPAIGSPAALNTPANTDSGDDSKPQLTTDGAGNWVAVWESKDSLGNTIGIDADVLFARSTDNGLTWSDPQPLNNTAGFDGASRDSEPQLTTDGAGTWLVVWKSDYEEIADGLDDDDDILFSKSSNNGATWSNAQPLNTTAEEDEGNDSKPQLTTDGVGTWMAVWASRDDLDETLNDDNDILFAVSTDNGTTWSTPQALNSTAGSDGQADDNEPQLTTDGAGRWVAVWKSRHNFDGIGGDEDILFARSTNNGLTWTDSQALNTSAASDSGDDKKPQVTTDGLGSWLAVWVSRDSLDAGVGTDEDILLAVSADHGATWSAPQILNATAADDGDAFDSEPQLTTDKAGNWIAVWKSKYNLASLGEDLGGDDDVLFARSTDNGATWTAPAALNRNADADSGSDTRPELTTDGSGHWIAVWDSRDTLGDTLGDDKDILVALLEIADCPDTDLCHTAACVGGVCVSTPVDCDDDNVCTDDSCDPAVGCLNVANTGPCDDGDTCTAVDTCAGGVCVGGSPLDCDDGNECTDDTCDAVDGCRHDNNTLTCDDGDACTVDDLCSGGVCAGSALQCDDGDLCTVDGCDAQSGCFNDPVDCGDNDACTVDSCDAQIGCLNEPLDCNDGSLCTTDSCDAVLGECVNAPISCDDGDACTVDSCDPQGGCLNEPLDCDDGSLCTTDSCAAVLGECVNAPISCDDGDACTVDSCDPQGGCLNEPLDCDDGSLCTTDSCAAVLGECVNAPISCDDGDACTADGCDPAVGCVNDLVACDDSNECTVDSCDTQIGCVHTTVDCDDGNLCTLDGCDVVQGCVYADVDCDDGDPCNGMELCDPAGGCGPGIPVDCNNNGNVDSCDIADGTSGDCNLNQVPDDCDIASGSSEDQDGSGVPDECELECPADLDGNFLVNAVDLAVLLGEWGVPDPVLADITGDGAVNGADLAVMLGTWGPCAGLLGACCNVDGAGGCEVLLQTQCATAGGLYLGSGSNCADCPPAACGPGAGDCCATGGTGSPGCEDIACCTVVCSEDSFCCDVEWDFICAADAALLCSSCVAAPPNDNCADSIVIADGDTAFSTVSASTDGPPHAECEFDGQTYNDIWYDYQASCSGELVVSTCEQADYDTDLVVYDGCDCPPSDANLLGCSDDDILCDGFTSRVLAPVVQGNCYKIRIGGFAAPDAGSGTLSTSCETLP